MLRKGADIVLECLVEHDVDKVFGYPGGAIMPLYDALYDYDDKIEHILTCHEQGATHAADGYARSTGKIGVCFATSGPGATNTVTGIATAQMDSIPLLVITGQVMMPLIGKDSFQEVDITGIVLPVAKHSFFVTRVEDLAETVRSAIKIAKSGRPGPVLIDIPKDLFSATCAYTYQKLEPIVSEQNQIASALLEEIGELINQAKRPVIYAGGGVRISKASEEVVALAKKTGMPVLNSLMSLGVMDRKDPLSLGMVGMHGYREANLAMHKSDLVLAIGTRFSDRVTGRVDTFAKDATIIHIDIDESEMGKNVGVHYGIAGDIKNVLTQLEPYVEAKNREAWLSEIQQWKRPSGFNSTHLNPETIFKTMEKVLGRDIIVSTEVGQHQMWTAQMWPFKDPNQFLTSGGLGTMGYGLGASIGAQVGNPDTVVVNIAGDGSFRMNCNELATLKIQKLPTITIIFKNDSLGMVRQWQKLFFEKRYSHTTLVDEIKYEHIAKAFGLNGVFVETIEGLEVALKEAKEKDEATVVVCDISKEEDVFPIVPPGGSNDQAINSVEEV